MKIGILTFHHSLNCGAALQAWALQTYLRGCGCDAEIVNYGKIGWPCKYYLRCDSLRHFAGSFYNGFNTFLKTFLIESYRRHLYRRFHQEYMHLGSSVRKNEIVQSGYTHLIAGSDQVWHPVINEGDETYFLANATNGVKRISYAPSFGVDTFEPSLEKKMAVWLSKFASLSVREPKGSEIVNRLCGREAQVVCDPTMLLDAAHYEKLERKPLLSLPQKYIAVYTICGHPWVESVAFELGRRMKIPVVHLQGGQLARWYFPTAVKHVTALGPSEFLYFIHHAEFVVTNSFHGTVFSLLYHRPFCVALNEKPSDERMINLLVGTGVEDRMARLKDECVRKCENLNINWTRVDETISRKADGGEVFLANALKVDVSTEGEVTR